MTAYHLGMSGNRTLLVMRHAKSSWKTNEPDARRPLNARGTRDAVVAGQAVAGFAPDVVWCSPALRAQQTWQAARLGGAACPDVRTADELYAASARTLLDVIRRTPASARTALVIAHEPGVSDLVLELSTSSRLRDEVEQKFPTAGIVALSFASDWDELGPASAVLTDFVVPRG